MKKTAFVAINLLFAFEWIFLAFNVESRSTWVLENILVAVFGWFTVIAFKKRLLSLGSYFLIFLFLSLHVLGAHYTYSLVPYDRWSETIFGSSLSDAFGWKRNHYDRLMHFLFGFLLFIPLKSFFHNFSRLQGFFLTVWTFLVIVTASTIYELLEWMTALVFHEGGGPEFIGTQGDPWDSQKDQALAIMGFIMMAIAEKFYLLKLDKSGE